MDRRHAALVRRIRIRAGLDQNPHDRRLRLGIPRSRPGSAIRRIVHRLRSAAPVAWYRRARFSSGYGLVGFAAAAWRNALSASGYCFKAMSIVPTLFHSFDVSGMTIVRLASTNAMPAAATLTTRRRARR